jgi:hypothetical protein
MHMEWTLGPKRKPLEIGDEGMSVDENGADVADIVDEDDALVGQLCFKTDGTVTGVLWIHPWKMVVTEDVDTTVALLKGLYLVAPDLDMRLGVISFKPATPKANLYTNANTERCEDSGCRTCYPDSDTKGS